MKTDNYIKEDNYDKGNYSLKINELNWFILDNGMRLSENETKCIENAFIYCLSTKILPINEYDYIILKLGLNRDLFDIKDAINISDVLELQIKKSLENSNYILDSDKLLYCINIFTCDDTKSLSSDEVTNVYIILRNIIIRMDEIKFINKYRDFYSKDFMYLYKHLFPE